MFGQVWISFKVDERKQWRVSGLKHFYSSAVVIENEGGKLQISGA